MRKSIILAKLNIKNYKKQTKIFSTILVVSLALLFIATALSEGFVLISQSYKTDDTGLREIHTWPLDTARGYDDTTVLKLSSMEHVIDASQYINAFLTQSYTIDIDGVSLQCLPMLRGTNRCLSFASRALIAEIQNDETASPIICGRDFKASDSSKAIIDENTCYILGYSDLNEIIGKTMEIHLSDISIKDVEIIGVCMAEYGSYYADLSHVDDYSRNAYLQSELCNPVFYSDDIIQELGLNSADVVDWYYENLRLMTDNTDNVKEISDKALSLFGYESLNEITTIERKADNVKSLSSFIYIISSILLFAAAVIIINTLMVQIIHQRKYTDMILKIGYQKGDIVRTYVIQNIIISAKTAVTAIAISFGVSCVIDVFLSVFYKNVSSIKRFAFLLDIPEALLRSCGVMVFITMLTGLVTNYQVNYIKRSGN